MADNKELLLAAYTMARPDLLTALSINPEKLSNNTAKAIFKVLLTEGPTYALPGPMMAALSDLPETLDSDEIFQTMRLIPDSDSVELTQLLELKSTVVRSAQESMLASRVHKVDQRFASGKVPAVELVNELSAALEDFKVGATHRSPTAAGVLARTRAKPPIVRYKVGSIELDDIFVGIDENGEPRTGMAGKGQIILVSAGYKRGKTREVLNWVVVLLDQGCSIALLVLEDDESTYATKLMATKFNLKPWQIERYIFGKARIERGEMPESALVSYVMSPDGSAWLGPDNGLLDRLLEAEQWFESLGDRLRIYEGESSSDYNIYRYEDAMELLSVDKATFGADFVVIDYVQQWAADYEGGKKQAYGLRSWAGRNKVGVIALSQMSNDTLKWGSEEGTLSAKGNGEWGAVAHIGIEIERDPAVGDLEFCINLKVARNGPGSRRVYVQYNTSTGKALKYLGTPEHMDLVQSTTPKAPKKGRSKNG